MATAQNPLPTIPPEPMMFFADETAAYLGNRDDPLKEGLRNIEGVPNATYLVKDGQVFIFDKLVCEVKDLRKVAPDAPLSDLALQALPLSLVSAKDAVENWNVVPEPYELIADGNVIRHRPFNARLPSTFQGRRDAQKTLARLLVGEVHPGSGDFTYRGQPLSLCDPLDVALLPPQPSIQPGLEPAPLGYTALGSITFEPGFEPVSAEMFAKAKELEAAWQDGSARAAFHVRIHAADLWARTADLRVGTLNDPNDAVPDYMVEEFAQLRPLYPELSALSDGSLYAVYDAYQMECCYLRSWTPSRDDDFLLYLIGKVAGGQFERETVKEVGAWAGFALLQGDSLEAALAIGRASALYDHAISTLAHRIAAAMRFIAEDRKAADLRGRSITTLMDSLRSCRSYTAKPVRVEQTLAAFMPKADGDGDPLALMFAIVADARQGWQRKDEDQHLTENPEGETRP